jgi:hypothetical protein
VLITAVCPLCRTSYQVQPSLRGQAIRCPNTLCRHVFVVPAEVPPAQPGNGARSGSVGDVVPILPAELAGGQPPARETPRPPAPAAPSWREAPPSVRKPAGSGPSPTPTARPAQPAPALAPPAPKPAQPAPPPEAATWRDAPPPVRQPGAPSPPAPPADTSVRRPASSADTLPGARRPEAAKQRPAQETLSDTTGRPLELPAGTWEPPPVRRDADAAKTSAPESAAPVVSRGRARKIMLFMIVVLVGALGTAGIIAWRTLLRGEEEVFADALRDYQDHKFIGAREQFKRLAENYPDSEKHPTYLFLQEWCELATRLHDPQADPLPTLEALEQFLKAHKGDPLLKSYARDVGAAFVAFVEGFGQRNTSPTGTGPFTVITRIDQVRTPVKAAGKDALGDADDERINKTLKTVREAVERWDRHYRVLTQLNDLKPTADGIREALRIISEKKEFFKSADDPEVKGLLDKLYDGHLAGVVYDKACEPDARPVPRDDTEPSVVIDPLLQGTPGGTPAGDPIVLALARGVLYALHKSNGSVKWARRVGIDTTTLPIRVPASSVARERILVLSSDRATLSAMDDDGNQLWQYRLSSPCLGRPLVVDQLAYLPTYEGVVHEIELARGGVVGCYRLGQHLTLGGVHEPDSKRLYFPADNSCVYVLDVGLHRCTLILYTSHPSGSLRSEPVLIPSVSPLVGNPTPGYLVLNQAEGLETNRLRVYELPLTDRHQAPLVLKPEPRLAGWTWFPPTRDAEKLVAVSDRGVLGLFGIKQANTKDQALFPMLGADGLALDSFLPQTTNAGGAVPSRGRSQVVQVNGDDVWVLARGWMLRLGIAWNNQDGPRPVAGWKAPLPLGSPLHASQIEEDPPRGRSTLFVVTQPLQQQTCVATAVNDEDGQVLWQRQLGLVCQGEPLPLVLHEGSPEPLLVALDQGGSLFALDPGRFPANSNAPWQSGGQSVAPSLADNPRVAPLLLPDPDRHAILEIACPGDGTHLHVRQVRWAGEKRLLKSNDRILRLPSALAGKPAVVGSQLIVPLAGGSLARLPLPIPADARLDEGPNWRPPLASPDTPGHVTSLGGDRFLTTDGGRGLTCWQWPPGAVWKSLMTVGDHPTAEVDDRVVAAPVVLPAPAGGTTRVCVADSGGVVTLLGLRADGSLEPKRKWDLKGQVTGGPFVRTLESGEVRLGCVVDGGRLVWLDPGASAPAWEHQAARAIIGQPQVVGGLLVVADQSGLINGLDVATGRPVGSGHQLYGSVVPAASPVAFGPGRLFVPLSDGTGILLAMDRLKAPPQKASEPGGGGKPLDNPPRKPVDNPPRLNDAA